VHQNVALTSRRRQSLDKIQELVTGLLMPREKVRVVVRNNDPLNAIVERFQVE
ncbi:hypothetical protein HAX54_051921, partial [Datura stramonium]|nr:hypothetical protein [Datura stramonium]